MTNRKRSGLPVVGSGVGGEKKLLWAFGLLLLGYAFYAMNHLSWSVVLPEIAEEFGLTMAMAGGLASAFLAGQMVMNLTMGAISDVVGRKTLLVSGIGLFSAFAIATGLSRGFGDLIVWRVLIGGGFGIYAVTIWSYVGEAFPKNRGAMLGLISTFFSVGGFAGPWLTGAIAASHGWRVPFLYIGAGGLVLTLLLGFLLPEIGSRTPAAAVEKTSRMTVRQYLADAAKAVPNRNVALAILINFIANIGFWVFIVWTPTYFREILGFTTARAGFAAGLWAVGSIVGAVGGGWVSDRLGRKVTLLGCGMLAAVAGYVLFAVPIPYVAACAVNLLFGLLIAPMWVIPIAMAQDAVDPAHIGMTTGLVQIAEGVSGILAPPIFGLLMESLPIGKMLAVGVVGSYGLIALLILVVRETRRKAAAAAPDSRAV